MEHWDLLSVLPSFGLALVWPFYGISPFLLLVMGILFCATVYWNYVTRFLFLETHT